MLNGLRSVFAGLVSVAFVCLACAPAHGDAVAPSAAGGSFTVGLNSRIATLDPNKWTSAIETAMAFQVYDFLVAVEPPNPVVQPWLAQSWSTSADGLVYTFKLRTDVKFQDGTPFDASAAKINLERISPQTVSASRRDIVSRLVRVTAPEPATLVVQLSSPFPGFLNALGLLPMVSPTAWDRWGDDYGQHPVGSGPFKVTDWVADDHLTLARNPDYAWPPATSSNPGAAKLDSVTFKLIVDPPARLVSFESGDTQMMMYVPLQDLSRIRSDPRYSVAQASTSGVPLTLYLNPNSGALTDRQVRLGIESALDRTELVNVAGYGVPPAASGLLTSTTRCVDDSLANIAAHDPARARQLLDQAGWQPGPDGVRRKDGKPLEFELVHYPDYANLAAAIQGQLRDVGIQLDLKMLDLPAASPLLRSGEESSALLALVGSGDPAILSTTFHSRWIGTNSASAAILHDGEIDSVLDQAAQEPDGTRQCQLYDQFQRRYLDFAVAYPVWELATPMAMRANVHGVRPVPLAPSMPLLQEVSIGN